MLTFVALSAFLFLIVAATWQRWGADAASRLILLLILITPTTITTSLGAAVLRPQFVLFLLLIGLLVASRKFLWQGGLRITDLLVGAMFMVVLFSLFRSGDCTITTPIGLIAGWIVPYVVGRLLIRTPDSARKLIPYFAVGITFLTAIAVCEALLHVNPFNVILGRNGSWASTNNIRWLGMRRADGTMTHPIYFGIFIAMLMPWALQAYAMARRAEGPRWWKALPILEVIGVIMPASRGATLLLLGCVAMIGILKKKFIRYVIVGGFLGGVMLLGAIGLDGSVQLLEAAAGESSNEMIFIKGEAHRYSGTNHRMLLLKVYEEALNDAGAFGFGRFLLSDPSHAAYVEPHLRLQFASIDNGYLVLALNHGYLSVGIILLLLLSFLGNSLGVWRQHRDNLVACGMSGVALAMFVVVFTVWLDNDYLFILLMSAGMMVSWNNTRGEETVAETEPQTSILENLMSMSSKSREIGQAYIPVPVPSKARDPRQNQGSIFSTTWFRGVYCLFALAAALAAAWFTAAKYEKAEWVHVCKLVYKKGSYWGNAFQAADTRLLAFSANSPETISQAAQATEGIPKQGNFVSQYANKVSARVLPGTDFIEIRTQWVDRELSSEMLSNLAQAMIVQLEEERDTRMQEAIKTRSNELETVAKDQRELMDTLKTIYAENDVVSSVATDLVNLRQQEHALNYEIFSAKVDVHALKLEHDYEMELSKSGNSAASDLTPGEVMEMNRLRRKIQDQRDRLILDMQLNQKKQELARLEKLALRGLIPMMDYESAQAEVKLLEAKLNDTGDLREYRKQLEKFENKELVAIASNTNKDADKLEIKLETKKKAILALEDRLKKLDKQESKLLGLVEIEDRHLATKRQLDRRLTSVEREVVELTRLHESGAFRLSLFEPPALAAEPIVSNKKKLLVGSAALFSMLLLSPVGLQIYLSGRSEGRQKMNFERMGLGDVPTVDVSVQAGQGRPMSAPKRRLIHYLNNELKKEEGCVLSFLRVGGNQSNHDRFIAEITDHLCRNINRALIVSLGPTTDNDRFLNLLSDQREIHASIGPFQVNSREQVAEYESDPVSENVDSRFDFQTADQVGSVLSLIQEFRSKYPLFIVTTCLEEGSACEIEQLAIESNCSVLCMSGNERPTTGVQEIVANITAYQKKMLVAVS